MKKIAIQGAETSFHDMAARAYFSAPISLVKCKTFRQQCIELTEGRADFAVMAIENSLAGSILPNYGLLEQHPITIIGEIYLQIQQHFMALPAQRLSDIKAVRSHPMALYQCSDFLEGHPHIESIETHDTAESAREIRGREIYGVAAIAGRSAAEKFQLEILAESIENDKRNYTRFLVLATEGTAEKVSSPDKASLTFHVQDEVGALAEVLNILRDNSLNLALIQSTPIMGLPDEYAFHVDVKWQQEVDFIAAMKKIRMVTKHFKILGKYCAGARKMTQ